MSKDSVEPRAGVRPGDWIAVHQIGGGAPRRGMIVEVLGRPGHEHYRVRWDEHHESIHFPTEGTAIERRVRRSAAAGRSVEEANLSIDDVAGELWWPAVIGAPRDEVAETIGGAVMPGGGPAAVCGRAGAGHGPPPDRERSAEHYGLRAGAGATRWRVMDVRYVCGDCGIKWFVRGGGDQLAPVPACGACGGALRPFTAGGASPPSNEPAREPDD